ncbi:efflux RND transporter permease subunit [Chondromyces apiculatus]|uniref:RND efflux system, inner membrane transporter CmeB n=1 Tax=Chondromyces apiculatus DSM 436 TaxID=1192034 RepID=A0A017T9M5_9BACT|nr:efflux RND transporter permease subunit [Chondromyces apiculatus]EYF05617.1 RND efflux system, inner membrane transporter CmeB [Chondromyces apiculatus DSM 436]
MPKFFIDRPIFAVVVAMFIALLGVLAIPRLAVSQYPSVAPPTVSIYASYPGATPQTLDQSVVSLIERELSSVKRLLYFQSSSDTSGSAQVTATFEPGTDPALALVDVQNRLKAVEPRLPASVRQNGLFVEDSASSFLMIVSLSSRDGSVDPTALGDLLARTIIDEIKRVPGVGRVQLWTSERAMRIWIDPMKLAAFALSPADVSMAINAQNLQFASGRIGALPSPTTQQITATVVAEGQLTTPEEFGAIVLRARPDGSRVLLRDVAEVEVGPQGYGSSSRSNGKPDAAIGIQLASGANAMKTSDLVRARMEELSQGLPPNVFYSVPFDTAPFVKLSVNKVIETLVEAMVLVFVVMFIFLQNIRYTLIPAVVVPVALLGTCAVMLLAGFSVNMLSLFGMVLAIGIIVDDAIVVVENVERLMAEEGLAPREATRKAMGEISGAVVGITLVLAAVFVPMAFASGAVGAIYRQFSLAMGVSIAFSAFLALTLTPALCVTVLKPHAADHGTRRGVFGWFNRHFDRLTGGYRRWVEGALGRRFRMLLGFAVIVAGLGVIYTRLPTAFLPEEDQGTVITDMQLPPDATYHRTLEAVAQVEAHFRSRPAVETVATYPGFGFSGSGQNVAIAYVMLKDWSQRPSGATAQSEAALANEAFSKIRDGLVFSVVPPPIGELANTSGFTFKLQDRMGRGNDALIAAQQQLLSLAEADPALTAVRADAQSDAAQVRLRIDRQKANALGVAFEDIASTLSTALGSSYVGDFPNQGRLQQVIVQARAESRMQVEDLLKLFVRNGSGQMVPLAAFTMVQWERGPLQLTRFNGYPAVGISGQPAQGRSTGEAMEAIERLASKLPPGFGIEWTGQSYQERLSGAEAPALLALSILVVFLVLAALYESWLIPLAVILVVPLGLVGAVLAMTVRGLPNDVFFKVGLITIMGLSAKNAILIIEFARSLRQGGMDARQAAMEAARLRFRPILMTSLAFILGVVPLMLARSAGSATQHAIGTGVFGGMLTATVFSIFFAPLFFVLMSRKV